MGAKEKATIIVATYTYNPTKVIKSPEIAKRIIDIIKDKSFVSIDFLVSCTLFPKSKIKWCLCMLLDANKIVKKGELYGVK